MSGNFEVFNPDNVLSEIILIDNISISESSLNTTDNGQLAENINIRSGGGAPFYNSPKYKHINDINRENYKKLTITFYHNGERHKFEKIVDKRLKVTVKDIEITLSNNKPDIRIMVERINS